MVVKDKPISSVVKIDPSLLRKVEEFVRKDENKLRFANKKQFIDLAVYEYLQSFEKLNEIKKGNKNEKRN